MVTKNTQLLFCVGGWQTGWHYATIEAMGNFWEKERSNMGAVYREELSANARKLIEQLLSLPQGWVTAAALAESIGVSRRTVLRELPAVEQWMQAAGGCFFLPEGGVCPAAQQYAGKGTGRGALRTDAGKRDLLDPAGYKNGRKGLGGFAAV